MESTSDGWLLAAILLGFPIVFLAIWSFVCAILATGSGYRSLADFRIERAAADEGEELPPPWYAMIGWVSYRGWILTLRSSRGGLTLLVARIFPFHPPIRVPWDRVREDGNSILLDGRVRLRAPEETLDAIRNLLPGDVKGRAAVPPTVP